MTGTMSRSTEDIYHDVQALLKDMHRLNDSYKNIYMQTSPPVGLAQIETAMQRISQDVMDLEQCHFIQLRSMIDDLECRVAEILRPLINDLLLVAQWFSTTVPQIHRDPRVQYISLYADEKRKLQSLNNELDRLHAETQHDSDRPPAAHIPLPNEGPGFCSGAIQLLNGRDEGRVAPVYKKADLDKLTDAQNRLLKRGGGFMFWKCRDCEFKIKYYVDESESSTILKTGELRYHSNSIAYRAAFLANSHLHHGTTPPTCKYGCLFCFAQGVPLHQKRQTMFKSSKDLMRHLESAHTHTIPYSLVQRTTKTVIGPTELRQGSYDLRIHGD